MVQQGKNDQTWVWILKLRIYSVSTIMLLPSLTITTHFNTIRKMEGIEHTTVLDQVPLFTTKRKKISVSTVIKGNMVFDLVFVVFL